MAANCPHSAHLPGWLSGALSQEEQASLAGHLETCVACQQTLESLTQPGDEWAFDKNDPDSSALCALVQRLQSERPQVRDAGGDMDAVLAVLVPASRAGSLGRMGNYEVLEVIGQGGMGVVLKAVDTRLDRVVALKVLSPCLAASASARQRFVREGRVAAAICHDNVVPIHAVDEAGGLPFLVMHYVRGVSLQQRLDRGDRPGLAEIVQIGAQVASGLAAAHAHGLVHRDVKPANILLDDAGRVKLSDFGLARAVDDFSLSQSGLVVGTPTYMAPEQARGEAVDHRADLFSLGSVLYVLCTGHAPFRASSTLATLRRVCDDEPEPIRGINPDVPSWLVELISRLHAKDPARRIASATEVARLLECAVSPIGLPGTELIRPGPARRARRWIWIAAAGFFLATLVVIGVTRLAQSGSAFFLSDDGVLVVEIEDPDAVTMVEADGRQVELVGRGRREVSLPPGTHAFWIEKNGTVVQRQLITIIRGDRTVVRVPLRLKTLRLRARLSAGTAWLGAVAVSPDGTRLAAGSDDLIVRVWDVRAEKLLAELPDCRNAVFTSDGARIITGCKDESVRIWNLASKTPGPPIARHRKKIRTLALSHQGKWLATGSEDGSSIVCEVATGREVWRFEPGGGWVLRVAFAPDDRLLAATYADNTVRLWNLETGNQVAHFSDRQGWLPALAYAIDGKTLATGWDSGAIVIWSLPVPQKVATLRGHNGLVNSLAYLPDGRHLVSVGSDKTVRVWDLDTSEEAFRGEAEGRIWSVAVDPKGQWLATAGEQKAVLIWELGP